MKETDEAAAAGAADDENPFLLEASAPETTTKKPSTRSQRKQSSLDEPRRSGRSGAHKQHVYADVGSSGIDEISSETSAKTTGSSSSSASESAAAAAARGEGSESDVSLGLDAGIEPGQPDVFIVESVLGKRRSRKVCVHYGISGSVSLFLSFVRAFFLYVYMCTCLFFFSDKCLSLSLPFPVATTSSLTVSETRVSREMGRLPQLRKLVGTPLKHERGLRRAYPGL